MARDYPYLRGRGLHEKAEQVKNITLTFSMWMSVIPAVMILAYLVARWQHLQFAFRIGLLFLSVFLFVQRFYDLILGLLRSDKRFGILSQVMLINAVGGLIVSVLLVYRWNIYGLFVGTALVTFGCLAFIDRANRYRFNYRWRWQELGRELRLGVPLVVASSLFLLLKSLDKLIIANKLGFYELGLYSIATMAYSYVMSLPMMLGHVWYPSLQEEYGRKQTAQGIKNYLLTTVFICSILVPTICGIAIFTVPVIVLVLLPKFAAGITAMKICVLSSFFVVLAQFGGSFLVTLDRYVVQIPILLGSIVLNCGLNLWLISQGAGLDGVAAGTLASYVVYGLMTYGFALRAVFDLQDVMLNLAKTLAFALLVTGCILLIDFTVRWDGMYSSAILKLVLFVLASIPLFWFLNKKTGLFRRLREALTHKRDLSTPSD
jgi:O-antigen/teichoic acid export membrane protein